MGSIILIERTIERINKYFYQFLTLFIAIFTIVFMILASNSDFLAIQFTFSAVLIIIFVSLMRSTKFSLIFTNSFFLYLIIIMDIFGVVGIFDSWVFNRLIYLTILNLFSLVISHTIYMKFKLENTNAELLELVNLLKHDLNTPINSVISYLDLIKLELSSTSKYLGKIEKQMYYISNVVSKSFELANIKQNVEINQENLFKIISDVKEFYEESINFQIEVGQNVEIQADRDKLIQVFMNIVDNAIIHGKASEINFLLEDRPDSKNFNLIIYNNGQNINKDIEKIVWQRGYSKGNKSSGLGMSIIEKIVLAHNWKIDLTIEPQTSFVIEIPYISEA